MTSAAPPRAGWLKLDQSGGVCEVNAAAAKILGGKPAQLIGRSLMSLVDKEDRPRFLRHLRQCHDATHVVCGEFNLEGAHNARRTVRLCTAPQRGKQRAFACCHLAFNETEIRRTREAVRESENRLQAMADSLPVLISYVDAEQRYRFNNAEYQRWFGQPRRAFLGRTVRDVVGLRAYARLKAHIEAALAGRQRTFEMQVPYKGAGLRDVQVDYVPHRNTQGKVAGFFALIRDITERKQAEARLHASERFNRVVLNSLAAHVAVVDRGGTILAVNNSWKRFARRSGDPSLVHTGPGANYLNVCEKAAASGDGEARRVLAGLRSVLARRRLRFTFEHEYACHTPKGERWFLLFISPLAMDGGAVITHVDITRRKLAESAAQRQAQVLAQVHDALIVTDHSGTIISWNRGAQRLYGYRAEEVLGRSVAVLYFPEDAAKARSVLHAVQGRSSFSTTLRNRRKNGTEIYVDLRLSLLRDDSGRPIGIIGSSNDITDRRASQEALRRSEANLAKAQEIARIGSYEFSVAEPGSFHWSKETFRIVGLSSRKPLSPEEYLHRIVHPDDQQRVVEARQKALRHHSPFNIEYRVVLPNNAVRYVQSIGEPIVDRSGKVVKIVGTVLDISERKRLEQEILQISELEQQRIAQDLHDELGQCLSGTRHLAAILERNLARKSMAESKDAGRILELITRAVEQTRTLARGLYPVKAEPNGLMLALEELAARTRQMFSVDCRFHCPLALRFQDNSVATHLYRIAQESISNAVRHGKVRRIRVALTSRRSTIALSVSDDGIGFRLNRRTEGMGIRIMRYRAATIGGTLLIRGSRNGGTKVICTLLRSPNGNTHCFRP